MRALKVDAGEHRVQDRAADVLEGDVDAGWTVPGERKSRHPGISVISVVISE